MSVGERFKKKTDSGRFFFFFIKRYLFCERVFHLFGPIYKHVWFHHHPQANKAGKKLLEFCTEVSKTLNQQLETTSLQNMTFEVVLWECISNMGLKWKLKTGSHGYAFSCLCSNIRTNMKHHIQRIQ